MRLDEDQNVAGNAGGCVVVREGRLQSQIGFAPVPSPLHSEMTNKCALAYFSILQACNSAEDSISRRRGFESHRARHFLGADTFYPASIQGNMSRIACPTT
jgi:hypothetical protein